MTAWPPITITQNTDGTITIASAGITQAQLPPGQDAQRQAMNVAASIAKHYGRTLPVTASGPDGTYHMSIHPNGDIDTHHTDNAQTPTTDNASNAANASNAGVASNLARDELDHTQPLPQTLHKQATLPPQRPPEPQRIEETIAPEPQGINRKTPQEKAEPATHNPGDSKDKPARTGRFKLLGLALIGPMLIILIALAALFGVRGLQPGGGESPKPTMPAPTKEIDKPTKPTEKPKPEPQSAPQPEPEPTPEPAPEPEPEPAPAPLPEPEPAPAPAPQPEPAPAPSGVASMNTSVNTSGGGAAHFAINLSGSGYATCSISIGGTGGAASTSIPGTAYATVSGIPLGTQSWTTSCDGLANSGTITIY